MNSRSKALLWAVLPLLLLTPPLLWLGRGFENQLAREERTRTQHTLELQAASVQRLLDRIGGKLDSLEKFVFDQTAAGKSVNSEQFDTFAAGLHASYQWIRAFQIVSNGVISHTYPLPGNEAAVGYNLFSDPRPIIGGDVARALKTGRETITGPLPLVQGGLGIIIRKPLPQTNASAARLVAIVFNIDPLLTAAGISAAETDNIEFAIRRDTGEVFFGAPAVFAHQPITHRLSLPDGSWEMGTKPLGGQPPVARNPATLFYLAGGTIIFLICLLVFLLARRQADLAETVAERTRELQDELSARQQVEAELRHLAQQLETERARLVAAQTVAKVGSWETDLATGTVIWSDETYRIFATTPGKFQPTHQGFLEFVHPDDRAAVAQALTKSLDKPYAGTIEHRVSLVNGSLKIVEERWQTFHDNQGKPIRAIGTCQDITARKQAEERIQYLNRVYAVLSDINQTIIREKDPQVMLAAACRIAVEKGRFRMAWIGLADFPTPRLKLVAHAGATVETLKIVDGLLGNESTEQRCSFTLQALQTGTHAVCNDIAQDPQAVGWREAALQRDYRAMASLPLKTQDKVIGTFNLYAGELDFFDDAELRLLDELALDISFALKVYEREQERVLAEDALRDSTRQLRALTARMETLQEQERIRISREIHDELGQKLTGLKMDLYWLENRLEQIGDEKLRATMEEKLITASATADETMVTVQRIAAELRPAMLDSLGLISTLRYEAKQFEGRTGIPVELNLPTAAVSLDNKVSTTTYRIFQEVLTNVARHAQATKVQAILEMTDTTLNLRVEDNGVGVSPEDLLNTKSLGLLGMTERAALLNGSVRVEGAPGQGTIVRLEIPIENKAMGDKQSGR